MSRQLFTAGNLAFFDCGGVRLMLSAPESADEEPRGVQFEDRPHLIARLAAHEVWMAFFRDSEQNLLAIMSEVPHASA